jgi:phosphate transport system substrate-binding protein
VRVLRTLAVCLTACLLLAIPAVAGSKQLIISGSTSMLPMVQKLAAAYHKAFPHIPTPRVGGGQSGVGITEVAAGRVDIGDVSRDPIKGVDPPLKFVKVARDGICVITNKANPLTTLSPETVREVFTGNIRDWSKVPGAHISGPIDLFDRDGTSGTQDAFQDIFLEETLKVSPGATAESSEGLEVNAVASDKSAIGFVSFAATINGGVHTVNYNNIPCTLNNAKSGQYKGVRNFWMAIKKIPTNEVVKFVNWVIKPHNKTVESIVGSEWISIH